MQGQALEGGLIDAPRDAARAFRAALDAIARPGRILTLQGARPPAPLSQAAGTLLLTLLDPDTPLWLAPALDRPAVRDWLRFHTGAPLTAARHEAGFALGVWEALAPLDGFAVGTAEYPDRSATLIVELASLDARGARLTGPGIADSAALDLPPGLAEARARAGVFPLGLDLFLAAGSRIAALPRSTRIG